MSDSNYFLWPRMKSPPNSSPGETNTRPLETVQKLYKTQYPPQPQPVHPAAVW